MGLIQGVDIRKCRESERSFGIVISVVGGVQKSSDRPVDGHSKGGEKEWAGMKGTLVRVKPYVQGGDCSGRRGGAGVPWMITGGEGGAGAPLFRKRKGRPERRGRTESKIDCPFIERCKYGKKKNRR